MSEPYEIGEGHSSVAVAGRAQLRGARAMETADLGVETVDASPAVLPRALYLSQVSCALRAAEHGSDTVSLLLVSLDGFGDLRDAIGRRSATHLVRLVGERLCACLSETDGMVGQLGDEQFGICLAGDAEAAMILGDRIQRALEVPFAVCGQELVVRATFGLVAVPVPLVARTC